MSDLRDPKFVEAAVSRARVFVVGAGGIGCEVLKDLVLTGFRHIEVIDLDTIDLSNLNRQFLFRKEHIGQPKAQVAAAAVREFVYRPCDRATALDALEIVAHHASVKDAAYGPAFVRRFDVVVNALDNVDARRHVNRVCLAAGVPLVESATEGYMGTVTPIVGGRTECYECQPRAAPRTFATCTIRSNPTELVHCVTWAKLLFARLWGAPDHTNAVSDVAGTAPAAAVFDQVFGRDVAALAAMDGLWRARRPPTPLTCAQVLASESSEDVAAYDAASADVSRDSASVAADHSVWSLPVCARVFVRAYEALAARWKKGGRSALAWDKDDAAAMDFVAAAANVRAHVFGIAPAPRFDVKSLAGSIVPAVATSNAVVAALAVAEAVKLVARAPALCRAVHLATSPARLFVAHRPEPPNPRCYVCGRHYLAVRTDTARTTLAQFVAVLLRGRLGLNDPSVTVGADIVYEAGEGLEPAEVAAYAAAAARPLAALRIRDGATVEVEDFSQDLTLSILISHAPYVAPPPDSKTPDDELLFTILPTPSHGHQDGHQE